MRDTYGNKDRWIPGDGLTQPIELRALQSVRTCRALRPKMSLAEINTAQSAEFDGKRRHSVLLLVVHRQCKLIKAQRYARIARLKAKATRQRTPGQDYFVKRVAS